MVSIMIPIAIAVTVAVSALQVQDLTTARFNELIRAYTELRATATQHRPRLQVTTERRSIEAASDVLADAIRAARTNARPGDIFDAEIAGTLRRRIGEALSAHGAGAADLRLEMATDTPAGPRHLAVNERFDWRFGTRT